MCADVVNTTAARDTCVVIEYALRDLIKRNLFSLGGDAQVEVQRAIVEHGRGRPLDGLGMGEIVGILRTSHFIDHLARAWGRELHGLKHLPWNMLVEARNLLAHGHWEASRPEAALYYASLEVIIESLGIAVIDRKVEPASPDAAVATGVRAEPVTSPCAPPEIAPGVGAPDPQPFHVGFERNREHLGAPLGAAQLRRAGDGSFAFFTQDFASRDGRGVFVLAWRSPQERAWCVRHGMAFVYQSDGMMASLGVPTCDERAVVSSTGVRAAVQDFEVGDQPWLKRRVCYHLDGPLRGHAFHTRGGIHVHWLRLGAESSPLGLPVSEEHRDVLGAYSRFEGGIIRWTRVTNTTEVKQGSP